MSNVFHAKIEEYNLSKIKDILQRGTSELGGIRAICQGKQNLLLKPNFIQPDQRDVCSTTHPIFLLAVIEFLQDHGFQVTIGESPAIGSVEACVQALELTDELKKRAVPYFTFRKLRSFQTAETDIYKKITIASELDQFDAIVNIPKLKTHCQHRFTGATKNLYGCVPGKRKALRHMQSKNNLGAFTRMLLNNASEAAPILNIADGIFSMHKHGPRKGDPFPLNRILISECYLTLDYTFCDIIGLSPLDTPLFQEAGIYTADQIYGDPIEEAVGFVHAPLVPIVFNPFQMIRSYFRSCRERLKEKFSTEK